MAQARYHRRHPYTARLTENRLLTLPGSRKETRHLVIDLADSGIAYAPGDALGVLPRNDPALVEATLLLIDGDPGTTVQAAGRSVSLRTALSRYSVIHRARRQFLVALAERLTGSDRAAVEQLLADPEACRDYLWTRDYIDILRQFPAARFTPDAFMATLARLTPRLYSVACSPLLHPREIHLAVNVVRYRHHGRDRTGVASGFLAYRAREVEVYLQPNRHFALPADEVDIIMVGPGVGVAPFRGFLQHRLATGASGRNWLFCGDWNRATDFYYEAEFREYLAARHLHRLDSAFSRDQAHKIYVQHRMQEQGAELWAWLAAGTYLYVCGDRRHMARDVHATLIALAREHGGMDSRAAEAYVNQTLMKEQRRYQRDLY